MQTRGFWELGHVSDEQLGASLAGLLAHGYRTEARIIAHLAEIEDRKLHSKAGAESLFAYCIERLGLSSSEAFHRITAARVARRFPVVFALIERRDLHLTAVCLLRDYLTPENHREILAEASHKTKEQVKELLARRFPRPDVASTIRKLPASRLSAAAPEPDEPPSGGSRPARGIVLPQADQEANASLSGSRVSGLPSTVPEEPAAPTLSASPASASLPPPSPVSASGLGPVFGRAPDPVPPPRAPVSVEPLSDARYRIQLNASSALKEKLELARALISHSNPSGDIAVVIERALDSLLEKVQKQRFGQTSRPRKPRTPGKPATPRAVEANPGARAAAKCPPSTSDRSRRRERISNATRREIAARDGLRCSYVSEHGSRCTARAFLQIHHEKPWARGGGSEPENLRLLCAAHNALLAERDFGAARVANRQASRSRG